MNEAVKLVPKSVDRRKQSMMKILQEVAKADPDSLMVLFVKDNKISVRIEFMDRLEVIGALEVFKQQTWDAE